ncbi:uncharacterized protein K460DRAFT_326500 [Cucurbitaria berberidis CBS 394.84]|uniref:DUF7918 domain-containing protein n=1 Tax=Cucurbitaria berberidis CBS 394.84 TaxID=1168544 RepID=A0A9P4LBW4_9PLEO|nr:uncharacterized protein K460DRAFT_326500 [Cucurbitaria berberidis CBS 394.84]KAF1850026.1 hypothetical protein K460DRAFT_326500 [Cucurbitaria berberidis CBS 394.84]
MAILSTCPGLKVEIIVDGEPLPEFDDQEADQESHTKTTYIEAKTGADFVVRYTVSALFSTDDISAQICIDGDEGNHNAHESHELNNTLVHTVEGRLSKAGRRVFIQKFQFAELTIVDGNTQLINKSLVQKLASLGMVTVKIQRIANLRKVRGGPSFKEDSKVDVVPEKALKGDARSHQAKLGIPKTHSKVHWWDWDIIDEPFATFNFKYRSLDALKILQIIPRTPSPVPLEERPEDDLNLNELRQLVRNFKGRIAAAPKLKKEDGTKRDRTIDINDEDDDEDDDEVVVVQSRSRKRRCGSSNEVIMID